MEVDSKTVTLVSKDGEKFCVDASLLRPADVLYSTFEDNGGDEIPVDCHAVTLAKVIDFLKLHAQQACKAIEKPLKSAKLEDLVQKQFADFVDVEQELLFELILAANFVECKPLLELACGKIACSLKGKSIEEVRKILNIKSDFTPEEEKQVQEEYRWMTEAAKQ